MRTILAAILVVGGMGLLSATATSAAPVSSAAIISAAANASPVVKARVYCYRHYTRTSRRRFLHWGHC